MGSSAPRELPQPARNIESLHREEQLTSFPLECPRLKDLVGSAKMGQADITQVLELPSEGGGPLPLPAITGRRRMQCTKWAGAGSEMCRDTNEIITHYSNQMSLFMFATPSFFVATLNGLDTYPHSVHGSGHKQHVSAVRADTEVLYNVKGLVSARDRVRVQYQFLHPALGGSSNQNMRVTIKTWY